VDANIPINAMAMGYVAKAFGDMPEIAFNLMRPDLTKNATALTCLLLIFLILQIFVGGFVYFIDVTKEQHTLKYKVLSNLMNFLGLITAFFTATLAIMEKMAICTWGGRHSGPVIQARSVQALGLNVV
jgi:hypothetical protein